MLVSRIAAKGIPCIAGIGNKQEAGFFNVGSPLVGRNVLSVNSFTQSKSLDKFSAYGPTLNLDIKPNIAAPGGGIPVTTKDGGYGVVSGMSLSGPLVAGIVALVGQARGGVLHTTLASSLLVSTARPQRYASGDGFMTVAQQGGGLISAWDAAHATTLVEPHSLAFNDTDHRESVSFVITNTAKSEDLPALCLVQGAADIKLGQSSVTVGPGKSETIHVSVTDPSGLDHERLPIWSGWIAVNGTDGKSLTIPYLGLAGSLNSVVSLNPAARTIRCIAGIIFTDPPNGQLPGPSRYMRPNSEWLSGDLPVKIEVLLDSRESLYNSAAPNISLGRRADTAAPDLSKACVPDAMVTEFAAVKSIGQIAGFPKHYMSRPRPNESPEPYWWDGSFAPGQYAPPGRYKLVVRALSPMGDAVNASHSQTIETDTVYVFYEHNTIS
ncbi:subtilisin-like protease, partial [Metarhizium majus ARSEF 297]